jgi:hypothetical protein
VFFEYTEDLPANFVYVQFVLWTSSGPGAARVARCMTRRLPTTGSQRAYLRAVHAPTAALLAAKKVALDAQSSAVCHKLQYLKLYVQNVETRTPNPSLKVPL